MPKRRGMSKRRGSRRSRRSMTMKRRVKYHGGRKRTRLGRKRGGGRKRKSRRIKRGGMKQVFSGVTAGDAHKSVLELIALGYPVEQLKGGRYSVQQLEAEKTKLTNFLNEKVPSQFSRILDDIMFENNEELYWKRIAQLNIAANNQDQNETKRLFEEIKQYKTRKKGLGKQAAIFHGVPQQQQQQQQ